LSKTKSKSKKILPTTQSNKSTPTSSGKSKSNKETSFPLVIIGFIIFITGIILSFIFYGEMWLPFIGMGVLFLGIYVIYKGFTRTPTATSKENKQVVILFVIFGMFFVPILFSLFQFDPLFSQPYSITNTSGTGCSEFRSMLESSGYQVETLLSSYNELQRISNYHPVNQTAVIVLGPKHFFGLFEVMSLIDFLKNGGRMFIACDLGTANEIALMQPILSFFGGSTFAFIQLENSYMYEEGSGYNFDVVTDIGVIRIYRGSCIQSTFGGGTAYLNTVTSSNTWIDKNNNGVFDADTEEKKSYPLAYSADNVIYFSDVELFTNQHIDAPGYSHRAFASQIINDLTGGDPNFLILFDEIHQLKNGLHPSYLFGFLLGNINFFQFFWALIPVGIYLVYKVVNRYIPNYAKSKKKELLKELKTKYKAKKKEKVGSVYVTKLNWYKRLGRFRDAANLLYNRLKRTLIKKLKLNSWDLDAVIEGIIESHFEEEHFDEKRLVKAFDYFEKIAEKRINITSEEDFLNVFLEMNWVSEQL